MSDRERAVALYMFLKEFSQLRTKTIRDIDRYKDTGMVIWTSEIPREPLCDCIAWNRGTADADHSPLDEVGEAWIQIRRPLPKPPPSPPESVIPWVQREELRNSSSGDLPNLLQTRFSEFGEGSELRLDDHPEVLPAWNVYLENHWLPWAEQDSRDRAVLSVYTTLFRMYERQQRVGESFELVFGLGLLSWIDPDNHTVRRHLVAAPVGVNFDTENGTLTVLPVEDTGRPVLEQDMLDPRHCPEPDVLRSIRDRLEEIGDMLWSAGPLDGLLKSWVHSISTEGKYSDELAQPNQASQIPVVQLAPALILRRRTEHSYVRAFSEVIERLKECDCVPIGVKHFVGISDSHPSSGSMAETSVNIPSSEIYFSLPANTEQWEIVRKLTNNQGVIVQGPPGTGKSHTIVNLICHALAIGQRVLVTSHTTRALKVLRGMISEHVADLAPLAVVLLGDDRAARQAMEKSVTGILSRQNTWNAEASERAITELLQELDKDRSREVTVLKDLLAIRERETRQHEQFGYRGTLARIADTLRCETEQLSWIPDKVSEDQDLPLVAGEFSEFVNLVRDHRVSEWEQSGWNPIDLSKLLPVEEFIETVEAERQARRAFDNIDSVTRRHEYSALSSLDACDRRALATGLRKLLTQIKQLKIYPLPWAKAVAKEILAGSGRTWRTLREDSYHTAMTLMKPESGLWLDDHEIRPKLNNDLAAVREDAKSLYQHLNAGRRWGFWIFRRGVVKRAGYLRKHRIGGHPCETPKALLDLQRRIEGDLTYSELRRRWDEHQHILTKTSFVDRANELADLCKPIDDAIVASDIKQELRPILRRESCDYEPDWSDADSLRYWIETLDAITVESQYQTIQARFDQFLQCIRTQHHCGHLDPTSDRMLRAIENRSTEDYSIAWELATENASLAERLARKLELLRSLRQAVPKLVSDLEETSASEVWNERSQTLGGAWNWSRAHTWITRLTKAGAEDQHRLELDATKQRIADTLGRIAAEKAWSQCFKRMTEAQRRHLVAWSLAIGAIGKGTGKHAARYRREAREHLSKCRSAIPAWVMPLRQVAETIQPEPEIFDLAIIDEASQSGPEAHLLTWLAKKLVVVGDDKQIRPTYPGLRHEAVYQLREHHIADLPYADSYRVNCSFFDLANIWYSARIRLREHFRCMPEIIEFSNQLSYTGEPLIPLRQYGAGRLKPTIATKYVRGGYQEGTGRSLQNRLEAEAIVTEIVQICARPEYAEKTIGVISLVGDTQARLIENALIQKLGTVKIRHHQIVCGDAYEFQGDERDVMFLSMVSAPHENRRIRAMSDQDTQRRFNVAVSRARDQLYLFHSASLSDLNPSCLRYRLLSYCLEPVLETLAEHGLNLRQIEHAAHAANRQDVKALHPFDSWFEVDVFLRISRRKYRVQPQFKMSGYRIDLVVEGWQGKLAVECDGDAWHGADRHEADAARQRELERCGLPFWRIRESVFRLNPETALDGLWDTLEKHGILPEAVEQQRGQTARSNTESATGRYDRFARTRPSMGRQAEEAPTAIAAETNAKPLISRPHQQTGKPSHGPGAEANDGYLLDMSSSHGSSVDGSEEEPFRSTTESPSGQPSLANTRHFDELGPYLEWTPQQTVPDPRTASQMELANLLTEVVHREGPVVAVRAYRLINRASGSLRLTAPARRALNQACMAAVRDGKVVTANPLNLEGQQQLVLRDPKTPEIVLRERGPRELDELPPDEVAMLLRSLGNGTDHVDGESLKKQALERLKWARLTRNINELLEQCIGLIQD